MSQTQRSTFGVIGLGTMGQNLALNVADHGFPVAVWNLESDWTDKFVAANPDKAVRGTKSLQELVEAIDRPRRILIMITAGVPVDKTLEKLVPLLAAGDVVIDGGNSWFKDTQRREETWRPSGVHFFGMGVSGGSEGARFGPSLMPGGAQPGYAAVEDVLQAISAKTDSGACVTHVGPDGAGHFVKMVHNGIEYGDMQLIAEIYDVMRRGLGLPVTQIAEQFATWNRGALESFLIEITAKVLTKREGDTPLVDLVLDSAGQKGTGRWTAEVALSLGVSVPTLAAALDGRVLSGLKQERVAASQKIAPPSSPRANYDLTSIVANLELALLAGKTCSYAQGMALIGRASAEYKWGIDLAEMARIWKGGCIIRARFLETIRAAYARDKQLVNLLVDPEVNDLMQRSQAALRRTLGLAIELGIPTPALSASLNYFDAYRSADLPQNLTQAQRDAFGAHTYVRKDRPDGGAVHTDWLA